MNANQKELFIKNMTENLPTLRKKLDISQEELSEKIGVSRSTIAGIENKREPCHGICSFLCCLFLLKMKIQINF